MAIVPRIRALRNAAISAHNQRGSECWLAAPVLALALTTQPAAAQADRYPPGMGMHLDGKEAAGIVLSGVGLITIPTFAVIDLVAFPHTPPSRRYGGLELCAGGVIPITGGILLWSTGEKKAVPWGGVMVVGGTILAAHGLYTIFRARPASVPLTAGVEAGPAGVLASVRWVQ